MKKYLKNLRSQWSIMLTATVFILFLALSPRLPIPMQNFGDTFAGTSISSKTDVWPTAGWLAATPFAMGMDAAELAQAENYALKGGGSGLVIRGGRLVWSWGNPTTQYELKSTTKSIGVTGFGLAIQDGRLNLDDFAAQHYQNFGKSPNSTTGWLHDVTIRQLATHTAGLEKDGTRPKLIFAPGTVWAYSDGGANWLADMLTEIYQRDLKELFFSRVFTPLGIPEAELSWRSGPKVKRNELLKREFGSGISASVNALARLGYLYLREGRWREEQLIPPAFVAQARSIQPNVVGLPVLLPEEFGNASDHYGLLWWNNADGTLQNVPRDAYWSWGLKDSFIIVIPSLDIVAARAGNGWRKGWSPDYQILRPFIEPIVQSVQ